MLLRSTVRRLAVVLTIGIVPGALAWEQCPNGGVCPDGNTCCPRSDGSSGCIPADLGALNATCCDDETGCAVGYRCIAKDRCRSISNPDPLVQVLPRYRLGVCPQVQHLRSFDLGANLSLPYYATSEIGPSFRRVIIVVHGANRNADDYLCSLSWLNPYALVIAPWFAQETDAGVPVGSLVWSNEGPPDPWRYGADAKQKVSSFEALDKMVAALDAEVVVVGHSAGGQFVQRWALLTDQPFLRAIVSNPSSYAYLSDQRKINGVWQRPLYCATYDEWEYGLEVSVENPVPYLDRVLNYMDHAALEARFLNRSVIYLAGGLDQCTVSGLDPSGWCQSHGLETTCECQLQGKHRWERSLHYFESLPVPHRHRLVAVPDVGHDHSLIFNSLQGIELLFGGGDYISLS